MNLTVPHLKIWLIVFSFGLIFAIGFYKYSSGRYGIQYKTAIEIEKLIKNNCASNKDTVSVIIVGSSLTLNAFGDNFDISTELTKQLGKPIKGLKINLYALTMDKASDLSLFQSIYKYPPDVLFIESRLFVEFIKNPKKIPFHLTYSMAFLVGKFKKIIGNSEVDNSINSLLNPELLNDYFTTKTDQNLLNLLLKRERRVRSFTENKAINNTFDQLNRKKKKVIMLGFPNSETVNKVFDKTELEFVKLAQEYQKAYNVTYWSIKTVPFTTNLFTDGSHLNYQGAKVYQKWFMEKVKATL
ncbi:MAG: hypothetical protein V4683_09575 [Bacteroidota bacterium]